MEEAEETVVVHISDIHVNGSYYSKELEENVIGFIWELRPDIIVVTGDLTDNGYVQEYRDAVSFLRRLKTDKILVVPGNHDSRNMGYVVFEKVFGTRYPFLRYRNIYIQGVDSSEPDLDDGHIGRLTYNMMRERLRDCEGVKIVALHHHLIPVPGTGRERNIPVDAGDFLRVLLELGVGIVLSGHKHVPWIWNLNGIIILHAGTATTLRLKAGVPPSLNVLRIRKEDIEVTRLNILKMKEKVIYKGTPTPIAVDESWNNEEPKIEKLETTVETSSSLMENF